MSRPLIAHIDLTAVIHNYQTIRAHLNAKNHLKTRIWAVIKADAYGHGAMRVAKTLEVIADGFALLEIDKAVLLREMGIKQPILLLEGVFSAEELALCERFDFAIAVHNEAQLLLLESLKSPLSVYLKWNSGMNRLGFLPQNALSIKDKLSDINNIRDLTLMTHFACADESFGIAPQMDAFAKVRKVFAKLPHQISLANSAATFLYEKTHENAVRTGISLYGASPFSDKSAVSLGLKPVMTLASEIIAIQALENGARIGYGGTFIAPHKMRIGVIACGYADGYSRLLGNAAASNNAPILVCGKRTKLVGRISMDMATCDLSTIPEATIGSRVILWGKEKETSAHLPIEEIAAAAQTIPYELLCALAPRVRINEIR